MENLWELIKRHRIFAVIRTDTPESALKAARACLQGGMRIIEITLTVPKALEVIKELAREEGPVVGAGTVTDAEKAKAAISAGAKFIVSPTIETEVIKTCKEARTFVSTGALTPTEVLRAWREGSDLVKVFPAASLGGYQYIKALKEPLPYIELMPSVGVDLENFIQFLEAGAAAVCLSDTLIDKRAINQGDWSKITRLAKKYVEKLEAYQTRLA